MFNDIQIIIMAGGVGSRFWPMSTPDYPKQFIDVMGVGRSLIQLTVDRLKPICPVKNMWVVTNKKYIRIVKEQIPDMPVDNILAEPEARNTAPCIAYACWKIQKKHPDANIVVTPSDALVINTSEYQRVLSKALSYTSDKNAIVTIGIKPSRPETGYGYIEAKDNQVLRFIEKPSKETAEHYISSGHFYWNTGIFCFSANTFIEEAKKHCPDVLNTVNTCLTHSRHSNGKHFIQIELDKKHFMAVPDISLDYAVMERSSNIAVVPCDIGWRDIGSWPAIESLENKDAHGNTTSGEVILHSVKNSYIRSNTKGRVIGVVGMEDVFIVDTPDALLVAKRSYAQDVKNIYIDLKNRGHETHKFHRTVTRPWGFYTVLEKGDGFNIKQILVKPKCSLSLQMHHQHH